MGFRLIIIRMNYLNFNGLPLRGLEVEFEFGPAVVRAASQVGKTVHPLVETLEHLYLFTFINILLTFQTFITIIRIQNSHL